MNCNIKSIENNGEDVFCIAKRQICSILLPSPTTHKTLACLHILKVCNPQGFFVFRNNKKELIKQFRIWFYNSSLHKNKIIDWRTLKPVIQLLIKQNLFKKHINGTVQLKSYSEIYQTLGYDNVKQAYLNRYINKVLIANNISTTNKKKLTYTTIKNIIMQALILKDLSQQSYMVDKHNQLCVIAKALEDKKGQKRISKKDFKKLKQYAKNKSISITDAINELLKNGKKQIVTGCIHLANKYNLKPNFANKIVNKLKYNNLIKRKIVIDVLDVKFAKYCNTIPSSNGKYSFKVLGSVIELK